MIERVNNVMNRMRRWTVLAVPKEKSNVSFRSMVNFTFTFRLKNSRL
jgi:hypothetical protein